MKPQFKVKITTPGLALLACAAIWCVAIQPVGATYLGPVVIKDDFTGSGSINGRNPGTNLTGHVWGAFFSPGIIANQSGHHDAAIMINLASDVGYVKPTVFLVSVDFNLNGHTLPGGVNPTSTPGIPRGMSLGFFPDFDINARRFVTGITYSPDGRLIVMTNNYPTTLSTPVAQATGFATSGTHNLAYWVDTISGSLYDVTLDGAPVTFNNPIPNVFTNSATMLVGVYGVSGSGTPNGLADNFTVTAALPEPSTVMLIGVGGAILWRRRHKIAD